MRHYIPAFPLKRINPEFSSLYPNLLQDERGNIISENITWFSNADKNTVLKMLELIESQVKREVGDYIEVFYRYISGNCWVGLFVNGDINNHKLRKVQSKYLKLSKKGYEYWQNKYEEFRKKRLK